MNYRLYKSLIITLLASLVLPSIALAVEEGDINPDSRTLPLVEMVDCFDYFKQGSVDLHLNNLEQSYSAGDEIKFSGFLQNKNSSPSFETSLLVKIAKVEREGDSKSLRIVDQFEAVSNTNIPQRKGDKYGKTNIEFVWKAPTTLPSGEYQLLSYVIVAGRYNVGGFPITDDVSADFFSFNINHNDNASFVYFDKKASKINELEYSPVGSTLLFGKDEDITVQSPIVNNTDKVINAKITWTEYSLDTFNKNSLLNTRSEELTLSPFESRMMYLRDTNKTKKNVYVVGEISYLDSKSIIDLKYERQGIASSRIISSGITVFPLRDESVSLYSCFAGSPSALNSTSTITYKITDSRGGVIFEESKDVFIKESISADIVFPVIARNNKNISLTVTLKQGEVLIDETILKYDCETNGVVCYPEENKDNSTKENKEIGIFEVIFLVLMTIIIFSFASLYFVKHKMGSPHLYQKKGDDSPLEEITNNQ